MLFISVQLIQVHAASMGEREGPTHALHGGGKGWVNHHLPQSLVALWALQTEVSIATFSYVSRQRWGTTALSHQMYSSASLKTHSHPARLNKSVIDDGRPFQFSRYFIHPWNKQTVLGGKPVAIHCMLRWDAKGIPASPALDLRLECRGHPCIPCAWITSPSSFHFKL